MLLGFGILANSCGQSQKEQSKTYPRQVGDIAFDLALDDPAFKVCHPEHIFQYYNFGKGLTYRGEKIEITRFFEKNIVPTTPEDTGYLTIRFIVNCEGKTGRFRMEQMSCDYQPMKFSETLTKQLHRLTTELSGWGVALDQNGQPRDYYQYLTFKMRNGMLEEILP